MTAKNAKGRYAMSRRRRNLIISICGALAAIAVFLDRGFIEHKPGQIFYSEQEPFSVDYQRYNSKSFKVVKVVDGDTIDINEPDGKKAFTRIRLWGVDTPETKKPGEPVMYYGPEACEFTKKTVGGKIVTIYLEQGHTRDKYERLLAYVQIDDSNFLNEELLKGGFAYADVRFKHSYYQHYQQLESAARRNKKGLWENVTREQLPGWLQRAKPTFLLKKAG